MCVRDSGTDSFIAHVYSLRADEVHLDAAARDTDRSLISARESELPPTEPQGQTHRTPRQCEYPMQKNDFSSVLFDTQTHYSIYK